MSAFAYIRVSSKEQNEDRQIIALKEMGVPENHIYIDKLRCPETYREFKGYEYLIDKDDNITSELVDKDNHFIDECRYALCMKIRYNN